MAQDTLLGFPAHTLPYRRGEFTTLSTVSAGPDRKFLSGPALLLLLYLPTEGPALNRFPRQRMDWYSANTLSSRSAAL